MIMENGISQVTSSSLDLLKWDSNVESPQEDNDQSMTFDEDQQTQVDFIVFILLSWV